MATKKSVTLELQPDIAEVTPIDALKAKMVECGTLDGKRDGAQIDALVAFGNTVSMGGNVFKYDPAATVAVLKPQIDAAAKEMAAIYIAAKDAASNDPLTEGSAKTYTYRFASAGMVAARSTDLIPELDAIATAYCKSADNDPKKKRIDVFYALCNWIRDEQNGDAGTKKRAAVPGRKVTLEEIQKPGFAKMVVDAGKKEKTATPATPAATTPAAPAAPAAPEPAAPVPSTPADYLAVMKELAGKLKDQPGIDPVVLKACQLLLLS